MQGIPEQSVGYELCEESAFPMHSDLIEKQVTADFGPNIREPSSQKARQGLFDIFGRHGLGVGMLVLHQRGMSTGHIPVSAGAAPVQLIGGCSDSFIYAHAPVRTIRRDHETLTKRGIVSEYPDPNRLVYHEDSLVGVFSFELARIKNLFPDTEPRNIVTDLLACLESGGVLKEASMDSWQVQFKDQRAAERIRRSRDADVQRIFVRTGRAFDPSNIRLPSNYDRDEIREILREELKYKAPCNYCSVRELYPKEDVASTCFVPDWSKRYRFSMNRSYEFGFTFAPFGEPEKVCHFLAWDHPSIAEVVNNMDLQEYSFGDLVRLTCVVNQDVETYCDARQIPFDPFWGVCNHWAGNSIYHQHYQFCRSIDLPIQKAGLTKSLLAHGRTGIGVHRLRWPIPVYRIVSGGEGGVDGVSELADKIAGLWSALGPPEERIDIGNGIIINNHTQNTIVTKEREKVEAYFVPRLRTKLDTSLHMGIRKTNLAALEAAGYMIIDDPGEWALITGLSHEDRRRFGQAALKDIAPDEARIRMFENKLAELNC